MCYQKIQKRLNRDGVLSRHNNDNHRPQTNSFTREVFQQTLMDRWMSDPDIQFVTSRFIKLFDGIGELSARELAYALAELLSRPEYAAEVERWLGQGDGNG